MSSKGQALPCSNFFLPISITETSRNMSTENLDLNILLSVRLRSITRLSTLKIIRYWSLYHGYFTYRSTVISNVIEYEELTCIYATRFCGTALNHSVEETGHFVFCPKPINFVFPLMNKTHYSAHSIILCKADYNEH